MRFPRFALGLLILFAADFLRVYWIMPFPGSQEDVATNAVQVEVAYFLHNNIWWIRVIGLALVIGPFVHYWRSGRWGRRIAITFPLLLSALVIYAFNFVMMADKMFHPPKQKMMAVQEVTDSTRNSLVIGVVRNDDARAYPIELIGFHHQVLDTIGGEAVLVTYCTVCRTGRAFEPKVMGEPEHFRLVGMDHFNAMFEDSRTGSWWRQVNGECIVGPLKGQRLVEVASEQMTLGEWARRYPDGLVFQPDTNYTDQYADLKGFNDGSTDSELEYRDSASWEMKSWVVGIDVGGRSRAYDWNDLQRLRAINDTLGDRPVLIAAIPDQTDYHVWDRDVNGDALIFAPAYKEDLLMDEKTRSYWDVDGKCILGPLMGSSLRPVQAYQEFWHSWRTFHPSTTRYGVRE